MPRQQIEEAPAMSVGGDVQKKIMPWANPRSVVPELFPGATDSTSQPELQRRGEKRGGGLILVASLLNKIPNLGGV